MTLRLIRTAIAAIGMIACALVAALVPLLWQDVNAPDLRHQIAFMAILIFVVAIFLRRWLRWPIVDFILGLLPVQVITLLVIASFSGYTWLQLLDPFNLEWLAGMNLFIALPWFVGFGLGSVGLRATRSDVSAEPPHAADGGVPGAP